MKLQWALLACAAAAGLTGCVAYPYAQDYDPEAYGVAPSYGMAPYIVETPPAYGYAYPYSYTAPYPAYGHPSYPSYGYPAYGVYPSRPYPAVRPHRPERPPHARPPHAHPHPRPKPKPRPEPSAQSPAPPAAQAPAPAPSARPGMRGRPGMDGGHNHGRREAPPPGG